MLGYDVVVIGAGAAGMMCALQAGRRGRRVLVVEHAKAPGEKIRISGGGRCNFTNLHCDPSAFLSQNPKFAISALKRYSQWDFIDFIAKNGITYHEKTLGQLFCDGSAKQIVALLVREMTLAGVELRLGAKIEDIQKKGDQFQLTISGKPVSAAAVVIASGGKSIPKMGATGYGYDVARQFGITVLPTRPGLVPLTFGGGDLERLKSLAGLSVPASVSCQSMQFREGLLFTHRGLSGPSILQISSYWQEGDDIAVNLLPDQPAMQALRDLRAKYPRQTPKTALTHILPKRLAALVAASVEVTGNMADMSDAALTSLAEGLSNWRLNPNGSEGYRTAEVTLGGVSTDELDARTMEVKSVPGLYFIGEVVDVTGWLGGYNFQWAWSSGWAAGQVV